MPFYEVAILNMHIYTLFVVSCIVFCIPTAIANCRCKIGVCARLRLPPDANTQICVRPVSQDIHVVGSIVRSGLWEPHVATPFYRAVLKNPSALVLDVGTHLGQYSLIAAASGSTVVGFEANPNNVEYLRASLALNALTMHIINQPVSVVTGQRFIQRGGPSRNVGGWGIRPNSTGNLISTTIDDTLLKLGYFTGPIIMKIDIEGHEPQALAGAHETLKRVILIYMEWGNQHATEAKIDMARQLLQFGLTTPCAATDFKDCPWDIVWKR